MSRDQKMSSFIGKTKVYIRCTNCKSLLNIHEKIESIDHRQLPAGYYSIQYSKVFNIKLETTLSLSCQKCDNNVGRIVGSEVVIASAGTQKTQISYACSKKERKQGELEPNYKHKMSYHNIQKFLSLNFASIQRKLASINVDRIIRREKQLRSFVKFYQQWKKKYGNSEKQKVAGSDQNAKVC